MSVQTHLSNTASSLVLSASEKSSINTSISTLKSRLKDHFSSDDLKGQLKFGSSTRGTILPRKADSKSDIDYMIIFDNSGNFKPQTFITRLKKFAEAKYSTSEIHQSYPTVVLEFNHIMFDLVPAYKSFWGTLHIPSPSSSFLNWTSTDPNGFNDKLSQKNQNNNYQIKPMIRLLKYWNALNGYVYDSYLLEQHLVGTSYYCSNLKEYFYSAVNSLPKWDLPQYKKDKVDRANKIVKDTKKYESDNMPNTAETEIKKLILAL